MIRRLSACSLAHLRLAVACLVVAGTIGSVSWASSLRRSATVRAVEQARPSVVNIHGQKVVRNDQFSADSTKRVNGMGTGVVIDPRGYILTNYHVVEGVRRIRVTLHNGRAYIARLIAHDPGTDLAIIKIPTKQRLPVITVGNSRDIMTGETVIAVGNAYGYEHTVTTGIVSAQHRNVAVNDTQSYKDLIQTDASINPGNSGGPLLNIDGQMIGINVAVRVGAQGIGFAIPVNRGMQVAARLMSVERLSGLWHGMTYEDAIIDDKAQVVVRDVTQGSPADHAGVREGDVILQVGGKAIDRGVQLECALLGTQAGQPVPFAIKRANQEVGLRVDLKPRPTAKQATTVVRKPALSEAHDLGIRFRSVGREQLTGAGDKFRGGLLITAVTAGSLAERQGIAQGDVLVGIHVWETVSADNLTYITQEADLTKQETVPFYILRDGKTMKGSLQAAALQGN